MRAWESGDQLGYQHARQIARRTQARALALYKKKIMEKLSHGSNDRVWWKMTRSLSGLSKPSRRLLHMWMPWVAFLLVNSPCLMILLFIYPHYRVTLLLSHLRITIIQDSHYAEKS